MSRTNTWKAGLMTERWDDEVVVKRLKTLGRVPVTVYFGSGLFELDKFWLGNFGSGRFGSRVDSGFFDSGTLGSELVHSAVKSGGFDPGSLVSWRLVSELVDPRCLDSGLLEAVRFNSGRLFSRRLASNRFDSEVDSGFFPAAGAGFPAARLPAEAWNGRKQIELSFHLLQVVIKKNHLNSWLGHVIKPRNWWP